MFQGDSLTVVLWLAGAGLATMIGALTAPAGWRARFLWVLTAAFVVAALAWVLVPAASPIYQAMSPVILALVESNALTMVGTVGVVALMLGGHRNRTTTTESKVDGAEGRQGPPSAEGDQRDQPEKRFRGDTISVILALDRAKKQAVSALSELSQVGRQRAADRQMPVMRAAFLTAHKECGIPLPPEGDGSFKDLARHVHMIEKILPYLRQGHVAEAKSQAQAFLDGTAYDEK